MSGNITDHRQPLSIYQIVLDLLPFLVDDSCDIFKLPIVAVDVANRTITVDGDFSGEFWTGQINQVVETSTDLETCTVSYDSGADQTTVEVKTLTAGQANIGDTLCVNGNYIEQLISRWTLQMMQKLQTCFVIPEDGSGNSQVGVESLYSLQQKMVIAHLVAWYMLFYQSMINAQGNSRQEVNPTPTPAPQKYLKTAKAGEVSYSWEFLKLQDTGFASLNTEKTMEFLKGEAICLARVLGCEVEVCADGSISCNCANNASPIVEMPFRVARRAGRCKTRYHGGGYYHSNRGGRYKR